MNKQPASLFELDGVPRMRETLPLALQHLVAMIVGCITPSLIIGAVAGLSADDIVLLIQSGLFIAGIATLIQLFPLFKKIGAGLPLIMGVSFAYVPTLIAIAGTSGMATLFSAQLVGGAVAIVFGVFAKHLRKFFPAVVAGTVVFTIGLSLYPVAINYMAGGAASPAYGSPQNWLVAFVTLGVVIFFSFFTKGFMKLASILFGIIVGYVVAAFLGMVDFSPMRDAEAFAVPKLLPFGLDFSAAAIPAIISMSIMFLVNSVQAIGDISATTAGGMDRLPTDRELSGGIVGNGAASMLGALLGGLPTATYSQNVGIVATTRVINRAVMGFTAVFVLLAAFVPAFGAALTTIPQCVLGGATLSVFASITMTGIKLITQDAMTPRVMSIVGVSVALGIGITSVPASLGQAPDWVRMIFGSSSVVISTIAAVALNLILPKDKAQPLPAAKEAAEKEAEPAAREETA